MSAFQTVAASPLGMVLRLTAILLLSGQILLLTVARARRRGAACLAGYCLHLAFSLAFLTLLLDGSYRLEYLPYARGYLPAVAALYRAPWLLIAGAELADALALALCFREQYRTARLHPTVQTVKEAVDLLPAGLCFSEADGTVLLSNLKMNEFCQQLAGRPLTDANALRAQIAEKGKEQDGRRLVRMADGTALLFAETPLALDGRSLVQLSAEDVSEQYRVTRELEKKNARLRELQYRMKSYQVHENELIMRQELLAARSTVHNQLGGALLTGKYHLEHPESTDPDAVRRMLVQLNTYLLAEVEDPEPHADIYDDALRLAAGIGVGVSVRGAVCAGGPRRDLLGMAIAECAANTVKHAGGDRLEVTADDDGFTITNNGQPPSREIIPSGGLHSLRLAAEQARGAMELSSSPRFMLRVRFRHGIGE